MTGIWGNVETIMHLENRPNTFMYEPTDGGTHIHLYLACCLVVCLPASLFPQMLYLGKSHSVQKKNISLLWIFHWELIHDMQGVLNIIQVLSVKIVNNSLFFTETLTHPSYNSTKSAWHSIQYSTANTTLKKITLPYITNISETINGLLQSHSVTVTHKPTKSL